MTENMLFEEYKKLIDKYLKNNALQVKDLHGKLYPLFVGMAEKAAVSYAINHVKGNQTHAANLLGVNRNTARTKIKEFGLMQQPVRGMYENKSI